MIRWLQETHKQMLVKIDVPSVFTKLGYINNSPEKNGIEIRSFRKEYNFVPQPYGKKPNPQHSPKQCQLPRHRRLCSRISASGLSP